MPTAPRLTERQVAVRPDATPYQSIGGITQEAFGSGRGLQVAASGLDQLAQTATKIKIEDNEREASDADVRYTAERRKILFGDGTEQNPGYFSLRGQDALDQAPVVQQQLDKLRNQLSSELKSENAKQMFSKSSAARLNSDLQHVGTYVNEQRTVANNTVSQARVKEAIDDAALGWNDEKVLNTSRAIIEGEVHRQAEMNGWSPEVTQSKLEEGRTALYRESIVTALKQKQTAAAKELYERYKGAMDAPVAAEVKQMLDKGELVAQSQVEADTIMASGVGPQDALALARAITDPELRDATVERVRRRIAEDETARRAAERQASADAFRHVFAGGSLDAWQLENPEDFENISSNGTIMSALMSAQDAVSEGRTFARVSDGETLAQFSNMSTAEKAAADPSHWRPRLTESEFNRLINMQSSAAARMGDNARARANHEFAISILRNYAPENVRENWDKQKNDNNQEVQNSLESQMGAFVSSILEQDRAPTQEELRAEAQRLTTELEFDRFTSEGVLGLGGPDRLNWLLESIGIPATTLAAQINELTPEQRKTIRVSIDDIPVGTQDDIKAGFQKYGRTATEDLIEQYAGAMAVNDFTRMQQLLRPETSAAPLP